VTERYEMDRMKARTSVPSSGLLYMKNRKKATLLHEGTFPTSSSTLRKTSYYMYTCVYVTSLAGAFGDVTPPPNLLAAKSFTESLASAT